MKKLQVAVIGLGKLGTACATALLDDGELALAGVVCRPGAQGALTGRLQRYPLVTHVRDLPHVDVALVCVPTEAVAGVARELLQSRLAIVECASLEGQALAAHHAMLDDVALSHRATAIVGAGWDPGVLPLFAHAFEVLIPRGQHTLHRHPGVSLHHSTAVVAHLPGVKGALEGEYHGAGGEMQRYVYVELAHGADFEPVRAAIEADPLYAGETTQVFEVGSLAELEAETGQGVVLERQAAPAAGGHASLLLEARFDPTAFAARVMLDAARRLPALRHGAHRYALGLF